jgi:murein L,D-transpeptidase YafK
MRALTSQRTELSAGLTLLKALARLGRRALAAVAVSSVGILSLAGHGAAPAAALTIELKDVAPDRIERQRAFAMGNLPLPGTPDVANLEQRLAAKQLKAGDQVYIRIFKAESELEIWMKRGQKFVLLDIYPICHWSGTIGPKVHEGDKQAPEGFYSVGRKQLHLFGRHPRSLDLGFPNSLDQALNRTGSFILVHGGCSSVGCFAMTNTVTAEVYDLSEKALKAGQERVHLHVFPFRMTDANLATYQNNPWLSFWRNLKQGYDAFEQTRVPPRVSICGKNYVVQRVAPGEGSEPGPLAPCGDSRAAISQASFPSAAPAPSQVSTQQPSPDLAPNIGPTNLGMTSRRSELSPLLPSRSEPTQSRPTPAAQLPTSSQAAPYQHDQTALTLASTEASPPPHRALLLPPNRLGASPAQMLAQQAQHLNLSSEPLNRTAHSKPAPKCDLARASCRKLSSLQGKLAATEAKLRPMKTARAR